MEKLQLMQVKFKALRSKFAIAVLQRFSVFRHPLQCWR